MTALNGARELRRLKEMIEHFKTLAIGSRKSKTTLEAIMRLAEKISKTKGLSESTRSESSSVLHGFSDYLRTVNRVLKK